MSEWSHSHSDQSKARISSAMRRVWQESFKHKRLQEKLYWLWARYVAEAAKRGGEDQRELDWDAFQKINAELNFEYLQEREEKLKAREAAKLEAEIVARERAEGLARRRRINEEKAKTKALARQNLLERKNKKILATDLKLIKTLAKIRCCKKTMVIPVSSQRYSEPSVEKLDLELIKAQKIQRSVSLAEQLQTLKSKKEEKC